MGNALPLPPGFEGMSTEEKVEYVQALWDHIAADAEALPVPDWQKQLLDERRADFEKNPDAGVPWSVVREGLLRRTGKSDK